MNSPRCERTPFLANRTCLLFLRLVTLLGIVLPWCGRFQAQEQALYGIAHKPTIGVNELDIIFKIDLDAGQATVVGPLGFDLTTSGADFSSDGTFWGFGQLADEQFVLFTADLTDGHGNIVQTFESDQIPACCPIGLACGPDGEFYLMNGSQLLLLDVESGTAETIMNLSFWSNNLSSAPDCVSFYTGVGRLFRIDPVDGSETLVASGLSGVDGGLALSPDGNLYSGNLVLVDVDAQTTERIASFALDGVGGLAFGPREVTCSETPKHWFLRGDSNDDGNIELTDAVCALNYLFLDGPAPGCLAAADVNAEDGVNIADPTYLLSYLFLGGPAPVAPFPECGSQEDADCETPPENCQ